MAEQPRYLRRPGPVQTVLGRSESNQLIILKSPPGRDDVDDSRLPADKGLFRLPDELLLQMLDLAVDDLKSWEGTHADNCRTAVAISITCRRLNRLVTPLLYSHLDLSIASYSYGPTMSRFAFRHLHRTLTENPSLRTHCHLAAWLTGTRELSVHGGFSRVKQTWPLIETAAQHMPMLEEISLSREEWGLYLKPVYETFGHLSHLKTLSLYGISEMPGTPSYQDFQERSSSITQLKISDFGDSPESLRRLVAWPAKLERFSFTWLYSNRFRPWSLGMMAAILSPHKATLQHMVIGGLTERNLAGFDLADYEKLDYLNLSTWATGFATGYEASLLAPRLTKFHWSFSVEDQHSESLFDFGDEQERWLRRLAETAIARRSTLREIHIHFAPDGWYPPREEDDDDLPRDPLPPVYPWDRMENVAKEIEGKGIKLSWTTPTVSRDIFPPREPVGADAAEVDREGD